ncbi:unnamed protein product [Rotaria sordida]|uniref:Gamma-glutamylcyclotransferase AIG2-like domain-containing protein n=1 Tax=Rotaria sordida TaxID=392033 RepID=A0A816B7X1_9BILA|nr:unnamed protein product [Rotaria sordida]CAF1605455.1 unnamed protein product [Rotaria sordida]
MCHLLATYGTLRDDNDSGAPWNPPFIQGIASATTGRVTGYRLFFNPKLNYPFAISTGDANDSVVVRVLAWPTREQFEQKLDEADKMEGVDYERKMVDVFIESSSNTIQAHFYVARSELIDDQCQLIPSGDWLRRHES